MRTASNELIRFVLVTPRAGQFIQLESLFYDIQIQHRVRFASSRLHDLLNRFKARTCGRRYPVAIRKL
jgi:hypothetical protein